MGDMVTYLPSAPGGFTRNFTPLGRQLGRLEGNKQLAEAVESEREDRATSRMDHAGSLLQTTFRAMSKLERIAAAEAGDNPVLANEYRELLLDFFLFGKDLNYAFQRGR